MSYASSLDHFSTLPGNMSGVSREARGTVQVLTKIVRNRTNTVRRTAEESLDDVRPVLERAVRHEEDITRSKMLAYENVGKSIGKSPSWVRKLVGRHAVGLRYLDYRNIMHVYGALCDSIAEDVARRRERTDELLREDGADASASIDAGVALGLEGRAGRSSEEA